MFVVEEKEWHVAILEEDTEVLIIENKDTSDSSVTAIDNKHIKEVLGAFKRE